MQASFRVSRSVIYGSAQYGSRMLNSCGLIEIALQQGSVTTLACGWRGEPMLILLQEMVARRVQKIFAIYRRVAPEVEASVDGLT